MQRESTDIVRTPDYGPDVSPWTHHLWVTCCITWTRGLSWVCQPLLQVRSHSGPRYARRAAVWSHMATAADPGWKSLPAHGLTLRVSGVDRWAADTPGTSQGPSRGSSGKSFTYRYKEGDSVCLWFSLISLMSQEVRIVQIKLFLKIIFPKTLMKKKIKPNAIVSNSVCLNIWTLELLSLLIILVNEKRGEYSRKVMGSIPKLRNSIGSLHVSPFPMWVFSR